VASIGEVASRPVLGVFITSTIERLELDHFGPPSPPAMDYDQYDEVLDAE
jgi:hypothetical protein